MIDALKGGKKKAPCFVEAGGLLLWVLLRAD
jgi:hypothetical protein